MSREETN